MVFRGRRAACSKTRSCDSWQVPLPPIALMPNENDWHRIPSSIHCSLHTRSELVSLVRNTRSGGIIASLYIRVKHSAVKKKRNKMHFNWNNICLAIYRNEINFVCYITGMGEVVLQLQSEISQFAHCNCYKRPIISIFYWIKCICMTK